jgi:hypothetical protein
LAGETTSGGAGRLPGFRRLLARFRRPSGGDQRQHPRVYDRPLKLLIDGRRYKTLDWSMSGMRIAGYPAAAAVPNATVAGTILASGQVKRGEFVAEVVRVLPDGSVGVRFVKLWSETFISMSAR